MGERDVGHKNTQPGETLPEKSLDEVRPTGNYEGIANGREED